MQINTPKTLRSGNGVFCESGIGVVAMECALRSGIEVYFRSGVGVWHRSGIGVRRKYAN